MKKRILALLLCLMLVLPCITVRAEKLRVYDTLTDDAVVRQLSSIVYALSTDKYRLAPSVRQVSILGSETLLEVLVKAVLSPSKETSLSPAVPERFTVYLLSVTESGRIATVDLGGDGDLMQPYELFCLKAAIVNTLIESGIVDYVNILFNGQEYATNDLPTGTMTRFSEDLQSAWVEYENEGVAAMRTPDYTFKRYVTLYFQSAQSNLLLAEVRQLSFTRSDLVTPVVQALIRGPSQSSSMKRTYPSSISLIDIPFYDQSTAGEPFVDLDFSYEFSKALSTQSSMRRTQLAPIVMTLTTFLPETDAVRVRVNRRVVESINVQEEGERLLYREQFTGLVGRTVELYYPMTDNRLYAVTRTVSQNRCTLRDLLDQLLLELDVEVEGVLSVFPEGFTGENLRGAALADDLALVNLTQAGAALFQTLTPERERGAIFAIVNTLTGYAGVSRVQFLVEGQTIETLAGGVDLRSPLVRNPGILYRAGNP